MWGHHSRQANFCKIAQGVILFLALLRFRLSFLALFLILLMILRKSFCIFLGLAQAYLGNLWIFFLFSRLIIFLIT